MSNPLFQRLFIFEVANNHQGSKEHAMRIIDAMAEIKHRHGINAGVKFQYRDLDTFIHPAFKDRTDIKHINRFLSTRLSREDFLELALYTKQKGVLAISTPFDEVSVQLCLDADLDIIKVASCSVSDWPLLEAISTAGKPVVISTGGTHLSDTDNVVNFFKHKGADFALMHCVALYPTPNDLMNLDVIPRLIKRYPGIEIGYSGHEPPDAVEPGIVSASKGAMLFERHVGVPTDTITLNNYSMNPDQTDKWVQAILRAWEMGGQADKIVSGEEHASLESLMRGTFARMEIKEGQPITPDMVYFAAPLQEGQLTSGQFGSYRTTYTASREYAPHEPIREAPEVDSVLLVRDYIHQAMGMLNEAGIPIGPECSLELSHHYGIENFRETGATIVNMINREYCKKLIVVFPGQKHPPHRHEKKEETFELLWGDLTVQLDDEVTVMKPGDRLLVTRATWHRFQSEGGAIFEEISTTHFRDDSHYEDQSISALDPLQRKTIIDGPL